MIAAKSPANRRRCSWCSILLLPATDRASTRLQGPATSAGATALRCADVCRCAAATSVETGYGVNLNAQLSKRR